MVLSKKFYRSGLQALISPVDLVLAWGKVADAAQYKQITITQSGRWFFYRPGPGSTIADSYIGNHAANNHIVPANANVLRAIKAIHKGLAVSLKGYLVDACWRRDGNDFTWRTSLTRTDSGNGACEVFYVHKVRIGDCVYQ